MVVVLLFLITVVFPQISIGTMSVQVPTQTSSHGVASSLTSILEKEQTVYRRCPPNPNVPVAEYSQDRSLLVRWCQTLVGQGDFGSPDELVQTVSASRGALLVSYMIY